MVDLAGYVIILVQTQDGKIKLFGSPADKNDLEIGDEIIEVNGRTLEASSHEEIINFIHEVSHSPGHRGVLLSLSHSQRRRPAAAHGRQVLRVEWGEMCRSRKGRQKDNTICA
ncbi:hypothetical protein ONE63_001952 [Megalurothrips usitatus]|uniref:PDZ domain-containing protein n=1 Tax=Megalurothrips usitatus TaxID=439358 RepID=A0AAV7XEB7_9NEOP|nr:hypothetical protein ONE63_001952 [Megalurothrips usitatus]